ncbi:hypothetical protein K7J14_14625 [Treponema zuelzerae]|uniref:Uncharacterized protein n=1 Tax=Teretinema zuelzerae TaxID=156 RepID=A0AAE3JJY9_9SPIR|nr:hypothetical protein [Teretinema zuelzerae]MCD1655931.1 hypothetical protein [Teretinema zuelzerae]
MNGVIEYLQNEQTKSNIIKLIKDNLNLYKQINTDEKIQSYSGSIYNHFVSECVQNNQYISLSNETINRINDIYLNLVKKLKQISTDNYNDELIDSIVSNHREQLLKALFENEYHKCDNQLYIPCSEYSGSFQYNLLRLNQFRLLEPIIDIGCGKDYELIKYLDYAGYTAIFGIDQYISNNNYIECTNWFDYKFEPNKWGTVIAHMSFCNHFRRSLINEDQNLEIYKEKYEEILKSLQINGLFIYTPSIKQIENSINKRIMQPFFCKFRSKQVGRLTQASTVCHSATGRFVRSA